jgi:hypothetical protein
MLFEVWAWFFLYLKGNCLPFSVGPLNKISGKWAPRLDRMKLSLENPIFDHFFRNLKPYICKNGEWCLPGAPKFIFHHHKLMILHISRKKTIQRCQIARLWKKIMRKIERNYVLTKQEKIKPNVSLRSSYPRGRT